jgi:cytochrome c553
MSLRGGRHIRFALHASLLLLCSLSCTGAVAAAGDAACHGADGRDTATPDVPRLAGQKAPYLEQVLREYRSGARKHTVVQQQAATLADEEIAALAAYYASQAAIFVK